MPLKENTGLGMIINLKIAEVWKSMEYRVTEFRES
jgi:hypothetical protein